MLPVKMVDFSFNYLSTRMYVCLFFAFRILMQLGLYVLKDDVRLWNLCQSWLDNIALDKFAEM